MAEKQTTSVDRYGTICLCKGVCLDCADNSCVVEEPIQKEEVISDTRGKRGLSDNIPAPSLKSPRTDLTSPDADNVEYKTPDEHLSSYTRRKSWRRATLSRRSLPSFPNPCQVLCRSVSTCLPQQDRLEKLMEASMKLVINRTKDSLQSVANASLESFQIQAEQMLNEWDCLAKSKHNESHGRELNANAVSLDNSTVQKDINRLKIECESWKTLLNKHKIIAEQLEKKVQQGQETGITPDSTSLARSSQYKVIQSKPHYHILLSSQQRTLQTMALIMDTQLKMVGNLVSIKEQFQLVVKETSGQLAAESGFQDLSSDLAKTLMEKP